MNGYIITGTNRGLGKALVVDALAKGDWVFSLARTPDSQDGRYYNKFCDLSHDDLFDKLSELFVHIPEKSLDALVLINNAGVLSPVKPIQRADVLQIQQCIQVNLTAPMILIAGFIKLSQKFELKRRIINISSGAAVHPYAGWATYCGTKAALNMLTKCVAFEQGSGPSAVKISSVAPGVLDTEMQLQIRNTSPEDFPLRERFLTLKEQGGLLAPQLVAKALLEFDRKGALGQGEHHDIRDMLNAVTQ